MKPINIDHFVWKPRDREEGEWFPPTFGLKNTGLLAAYWPDGKRAYLEFHGLCIHVDALRVKLLGVSEEQVVCDARFEADLFYMQRVAHGNIQSGHLPGVTGEWVIWLHPFAA